MPSTPKFGGIPELVRKQRDRRQPVALATPIQEAVAAIVKEPVPSTFCKIRSISLRLGG